MMTEPIVLTAQENRVFKLLRAGISQAEIARVLGVSRQRVTKIVQHLRAKGLLKEGEQ